jgi:hypothetical protein
MVSARPAWLPASTDYNQTPDGLLKMPPHSHFERNETASPSRASCPVSINEPALDIPSSLGR